MVPREMAREAQQVGFKGLVLCILLEELGITRLRFRRLTRHIKALKAVTEVSMTVSICLSSRPPRHAVFGTQHRLCGSRPPRMSADLLAGRSDGKLQLGFPMRGEPAGSVW